MLLSLVRLHFEIYNGIGRVICLGRDLIRLVGQVGHVCLNQLRRGSTLEVWMRLYLRVLALNVRSCNRLMIDLSLLHSNP